MIITAWEAAGDWELWDGKCLRIKGGRSVYGSASAVFSDRRDSVRLERFVAEQDDIGPYLRVIRRYVKPDTSLEIVDCPDCI